MQDAYYYSAECQLLLLQENKRHAQDAVMQTALQSLGMLEQDLPHSVQLRCDVFTNLRMMLLLPAEIRQEYTDVTIQTYRLWASPRTRALMDGGGANAQDNMKTHLAQFRVLCVYEQCSAVQRRAVQAAVHRLSRVFQVEWIVQNDGKKLRFDEEELTPRRTP